MSAISTGIPVTYGDVMSTAKFSVARYQRMIEAGILTDEDKVELLENYVVLKMPRNPLHDGTVQTLAETLTAALPGGWNTRVQSAVTLADSQPEPDLAVVRGGGRAFRTRHPGPADIGLLAEVADSSLPRDQHDKTRIYARAGITVYWIVNLVDGCVEVYTQPTGPVSGTPAYQARHTFRPGDELSLVLDGNTVALIPAADLLL